MQWIVYGFVAFGEIVVSFIKVYWPKLIAKFGWQALVLGIQKIFSGIIITMVTSFWLGFLAFISSAYFRISDFIATLNTGNAFGGGSGAAGNALSCSYAILQATGIETGLLSALPFLYFTIIFVLSTVLYTVTKELLNTIGDELSKHLNLLTK